MLIFASSEAGIQLLYVVNSVGAFLKCKINNYIFGVYQLTCFKRKTVVLNNNSKSVLVYNNIYDFVFPSFMAWAGVQVELCPPGIFQNNFFPVVMSHLYKNSLW